MYVTLNGTTIIECDFTRTRINAKLTRRRHRRPSSCQIRKYLFSKRIYENNGLRIFFSLSPLDVESDPPSSTYNKTAFTCIEFTCGNRTENHKRVCNLRTAERVKLRRRVVTHCAFLTRSDYWRALLRWRIICVVFAQKTRSAARSSQPTHYTLHGYRQGKHTHASYCTTRGVRRPQTRTYCARTIIGGWFDVLQYTCMHMCVYTCCSNANVDRRIVEPESRRRRPKVGFR